MASEKNCSREEATSSTSIATKGEHSGAPSVINTFANDGSFLELFKKRMEEESKKSKASEKSVSEDNVEKKVKEDLEQNQTEGKVPGSTKMLAQQGKRTFAVGKMGGASRQMHAKKKKQEKEAAEAAKKAEEEAVSKSSAWKAYMDEVQKYKEMSCSDDSDRVRPLVK
ncbi:telomerase RNA component interacting RNase-like [Porites lutea]|uniref:telomerase RNA component interacting RNase-like n=1 Tax=Porites lutea TaxID=51062 RepID=UPI003CC675FC